MTFRTRLILFLTSVLFYLSLQFYTSYFLNTWRGEVVVIPVMLSAILLGFKPTLIVTLLLLFPINLLLCFLFKIDVSVTVLSINGVIGNVAIMIFGCVTGHVRDLNIKRREEMARLKDAEDKLKEYRNQLESMVEEKTAELSEKISQLKTQERERIRLLKAIEQAAEIIMTMDADGIVQYVNPATTNLFGYNADEVIGLNIFKTTQSAPPDFHEKVFTAINKGESWNKTMPKKQKDGGNRLIDITISPISDEAGILTNLLLIGRDVTNETEMEDRLRQSQKMESIGTLAGGIAHDFNNILSVVIGFTELSIEKVKDRPDVHRSLNLSLEASNRAKDLVSQILTFSRSKNIIKEQIRTIPIVKEVCKFIRSSLPTTIEIKQDIKAENDCIMSDPTQFQQILMNLCTNAGHAMEKTGGELDVSLEETDIHEDDMLTYPSLKPGPHLKLSVKDTGSGISEENLERIFDPYFTTKGVGEGTGLGLAVVHGIVRDYGGDIKVYSEVNHGTILHVLFPLIKETENVSIPDIPESIPEGAEAIMLVDDEELIVELGKVMLEQQGYTVTGITDPEKALDMFKSSSNSYDLIITDKTMPKMTGLDLAAKIREIRPTIPILLCTGFQDKGIDDNIKKAGIAEYVMKPLNRREIAIAVRNVLDKKTT